MAASISKGHITEVKETVVVNNGTCEYAKELIGNGIHERG